MSKLYAGAGKCEILFPEEIFPLEGFYKVHDNPHVRVLCLEKDMRFAIVAMELVMLPDDLLEECKAIVADELGVSSECVWIHVTHAITTPHSPGGPLIGPGGEVRPIPDEWKHMNISIPRILEQREIYFSVIKKALQSACEEAGQSFTEAVIGIGSGICDVNVNRDVKTDFGWWIGKESDGYSNKRMTIITCRDLDGKNIASVVSYGIKPCVIDNSQMREGKRQISADVTGVMCRELEKEVQAPVLFLMSAAGDQIPKKSVLYDEITAQGEVVTVDLGVEQGLTYVEELGMEMAEAAKQILRDISCAQLEGTVSYQNDQLTWERKARCKMQPTQEIAYVSEGECKIPVGVLHLGKELVLVGTKPEVNAITEKQLKDASPVEHTLLVSMVNGGMKYMPDEESFHRITWEALSSMVMPKAAEAFVQLATKMI